MTIQTIDADPRHFALAIDPAERSRGRVTPNGKSRSFDLPGLAGLTGASEQRMVESTHERSACRHQRTGDPVDRALVLTRAFGARSTLTVARCPARPSMRCCVSPRT